MSIERDILQWYKDRMDASNREEDDTVSDLDECIVDTCYSWAEDQINKGREI